MLADEFDAFLIDLDGVVWVGDVPIPGAVDALARLRSMGRVLRFVTNDPRPTTGDVHRRLRGVGVAAEPPEIFTSGRATAAYLRRHHLTPTHVLGSPGLEAEVRAAGIEVSAGPDVAAVVTGCDERITYTDLSRATTLLSTPGTAFVATNEDGSFPGPDGPLPATGAIVAALQAATGRRPVVIGKPAPPMFTAALAGLGGTARVAMVGDRMESDVAGARAAGIAAILVAAGPVAGPDAVIGSLAGLFA